MALIFRRNCPPSQVEGLDWCLIKYLPAVLYGHTHHAALWLPCGALPLHLQQFSICNACFLCLGSLNSHMQLLVHGFLGVDALWQALTSFWGKGAESKKFRVYKALSVATRHFFQCRKKKKKKKSYHGQYVNM